MKILVVIGSLKIGGAEKQAVQMVNKFQELGFDARLLTLHKDENESSTLEPPSKIVNFSFPKKVVSLNFLYQLYKYIHYLKKHKFDVVHSFLPEAVVITSISKNIAKIPALHIAGVRGEYFKNIGLKEKFYIHLLRKSDAVFCNSNYLRNITEDFYLVDEKKIKVIPNGVELPQLNEKIRSSQLKAVVVANYHKYKGYDLLFSALSLLTKPLEVHIIGRGDFKKAFKNLLEKIPSSININFRGEMNQVSIYQKFDFAIHPSTSEGLSNAIMEELANGLPVIAFNIGGNKELIENGYNGFLIDNIDSQALAEKIHILQKSPDLLQRFSRNTKEKIEIFSFDNMAINHIKTYQAILQARQQKM